MIKFEYALGVVAPTKLVPVLRQLQQDTGCSYASCYRGSNARALLNAHGLHDQAQIYQEFLNGTEPNPANPPGRSTHECRSDGVPYAGPVGRRLAWWQCGMDVDDAHVLACVAAAAKHGWVAFRPYPTGSEFHHLNLAKLPKVVDPFLPLKVGKRNVFVYILRARLRALGWRMADGNGKPLPKGNRFDSTTEKVVKRFQKEHGVPADGVVGPVTWRLVQKLARSHKHAKEITHV